MKGATQTAKQTEAEIKARENLERAVEQSPYLSMKAGVAEVDVWDDDKGEEVTETHKGFFVTHDHAKDPETDETEVKEYFVSAERVHGVLVPYRCSCPHHKYKNARCKHIHYVNMDLDANPFE